MDTCSYQVEESGMLWQLISGANGEMDGSTPPLFDHSLNKPEGHFMFADPQTAQGKTGKARFYTPGES